MEAVDVRFPGEQPESIPRIGQAAANQSGVDNAFGDVHPPWTVGTSFPIASKHTNQN